MLGRLYTQLGFSEFEICNQAIDWLSHVDRIHGILFYSFSPKWFKFKSSNWDLYKIDHTSSSWTMKVTLCPCSDVNVPSEVTIRSPRGALPGHCCGLAVYCSRTPSVQLLDTTFLYLLKKGNRAAKGRATKVCIYLFHGSFASPRSSLSHAH